MSKAAFHLVRNLGETFQLMRSKILKVNLSFFFVLEQFHKKDCWMTLIYDISFTHLCLLHIHFKSSGCELGSRRSNNIFHCAWVMRVNKFVVFKMSVTQVLHNIYLDGSLSHLSRAFLSLSWYKNSFRPYHPCIFFIFNRMELVLIWQYSTIIIIKIWQKSYKIKCFKITEITLKVYRTQFYTYLWWQADKTNTFNSLIPKIHTVRSSPFSCDQCL
jgi:hypothetical protein